MKFLLALMFTLFLASCAHHHNKPKHHHHAYEKQCAYNVAHGKLNVKGKKEYKLEHSGKTYYFSNMESKKKFEKNLEENIKSASENWGRHRGVR